MKLTCLIALIIGLNSELTRAQISYDALTSDQDLKRTYLAQVKKNYKDANVPASKEYYKVLNRFHRYRYKASLNRVEYDHLLIHPRFNVYLEQLKGRIADSNPNHNFDIIIPVVVRYPIANAFSVGDGTIAINLGMLYYLTNEAQLAFILCHEIAHTLLDHSDREYLRKHKEVNSDEFQAAMERISSSEYYQATKVKELLKSNIYSERRHSRNVEGEADSLGLILYLNAGYPFSGVEEVMNLLDKLNNKPPDRPDTDLFSQFDLPRVTYKLESLRIRRTADEDALEDDSVQTHPECMKRLEVMKQNVFEVSMEEYWNNDFEEIKANAYVQLLYAMLNFGYYGRALEISLFDSLKDIDALFKHTATILVVHDLVRARKDHRLNRYVPKPNESQNNVSSDLSHLLYGTRFSVLAEAMYQYANPLYENSLQDEVTDLAILRLAELAKQEEDLENLTEDFINKYPGADETKQLLIERRMRRLRK